MKTKYQDRLTTIAKKELPEVLYDVNQATAVMPLQQCCRKLAHMLQLLLHDHLLLLNQLDQGARTEAPSPAPAPVVAPPPAPVLTPQAVPPLALEASLPAVDADPVSAASNNVVSIPGMPAVDIDPNKINVVVTPQGTQVIAVPNAPAAPSTGGELPDIPAAG